MKILIIEDDKEVSSLLKSSLKREVYSVDCAYDGEKGLFLFRTKELQWRWKTLPGLNAGDVTAVYRRVPRSQKQIKTMRPVLEEVKRSFTSCWVLPLFS